MAATITTTYQVNGSRKFRAVVQITGDAAGDAIAVDVINVANLAPGPDGVPTEFKIESVDWEFTGFTGALLWDGTPDVLAVALPQYDGSIGFLQPLKNSAGAGKTGKLHITTDGLGAAKWGTIIIQGRHK